MGLKIYERSATFSPSSFGLKAGDILDVICVGGGSSGAYFASGSASESVAGGNSSFGNISSANGTIMAKGEMPTESGRVGCGAGGYMPGVPFYGGNGGYPIGMAGTSQSPVSPYCNPGGNGNKGATGGYLPFVASGQAFAPAGNGYGAGGGAARTTGNSIQNGGDAGKIEFGSVVLANTNNISVVVGSGGVNAGNSDQKGAPGVVIVFW